MFEFLDARKWEEKNRTNFYWVMLLYTSVAYNMEVLEHFQTKHYTWRDDRVVNFSCLILGYFVSKYMLKKILKNLTHKDLIWFKNVLVKFFETFCPKIYTRKYLKQYRT